MSALLVLVVTMSMLGATLLAPAISPSAHAVAFVVFWAVCGWLTFTVILLALFDILVVKRDARAARREMERKIDDP